MTPYYIDKVEMRGIFVYVRILDANDEHYSLELKLTADDFKKAFEK